MSSLQEIRDLLNSHVDVGAQYSQVQSYDILDRRRLHWERGKLAWSDFSSQNLWLQRSLWPSGWQVKMAQSFDELSADPPQMTFGERRSSPFRDSTREIMVSKPIRQLYSRDDSHLEHPDHEEIMLLGANLLEQGGNPTHLIYGDTRVRFSFWDTEGSHDIRDYVNASAHMRHQASTPEEPSGELKNDYHSEHLDIADLPWEASVKRWRQHLNYELYNGDDIDSLPWIFSPKSFAQLILGSLGPTLCLDRPDPFHPNMNPASLEKKRVTPECFTLISSPNLITHGSFLDQEGVPSRRLVLIEDGVLRNFLLSRQSAFQLGRSLSLRSEKTLAGSSSLDFSLGKIKPQMHHLEVVPGPSLAETLDQSYVYFSHLEISPINEHYDKFTVHARNVVIHKYGGMHRRRCPRLQFSISRNDLWNHLISIGDQPEMVYLPLRKEFLPNQPLCCFSIPHGLFKGMPCSWT